MLSNELSHWLIVSTLTIKTYLKSCYSIEIQSFYSIYKRLYLINLKLTFFISLFIIYK